MEYKIQDVKLAKELGGVKAASKLGIPENTMYAWTKAAREGRLDVSPGLHTPQTAMSLAEELSLLRGQVKEQEKEIRRLKEKNDSGGSEDLIFRYFIGYWNNRRICSANEGLPPMVKRQRY